MAEIWGAVIGVAGVVAGGAMASNTASNNADAAANAQAQTLNATNPYQLNVNGTTISSGGGVASGALSGPLSIAQGQLMAGSQNALQGLDTLQSNGGMSPLLSNAYNSYFGSTPNANQPGQQGLANSLMGGTGTQGQLGGMFAGSAAGALGQLGSFDPTAAGNSYAQVLAQQQAPGNALAANNLGQNLFNTGNLGATGGANQMAALQQSQGLQWTNDQVAGQQLGLQQQGQLANMANTFGSSSNSLLGNSFNQGAALNQNLYANQQNQAQQGFTNQLNLNTSANSNLSSQASLGTGLLQGGLGLDQYLQSLLQTSSGMGAARTGAAISGAQTNLMGQLGANNANGTLGQNLIGSLTQAGQTYAAGNYGNGYSVTPGGGNGGDAIQGMFDQTQPGVSGGTTTNFEGG